MPRFQSRLFNWIDQSLPVSLGRKARRALMDVASGELWRHLSWADWQAWWQKIWFTPQLPRLAGYQVVRALLMPARVVTAPLKRKYLQAKYLQSKFLKSREYLGIAPSESQPEPLLSGVEQALLPEGATDAISKAEPAPEPLSEIQFYDLWWAKPKSQLGNFANLDNGTNQLDFPQDLLSEMTSLADLHPDLSLINTELDARSPEPRAPLPPRWLRPLVRFTAWLENTNLKVEREITALTLQVNTALATIPTNAAPTPETERIAANRAFAVAFAESLQRSRHAANSEINSLNNNQQSESSQLSHIPNNDLSYHSSPNDGDSLIQADSQSQYNIDANSTAPSQWQKIQCLLAAALDYFTGKSARQLQGKTDSSNNGTSNNLNPDHAASQGNLLENSADVTSGILTGEDRTNRKNLVARKSARNLAAKLAAPEPTPELKGNTPPALNSTGELVPNLTQVPIITDEQFPNSALNFSDDPANPLGNHPDNTSLDTPPQTLAPQDPLARLSELLDAAAAYFFGKKIDEPATNVNGLNDSSKDYESLSGNNSPILDDAPTEAPWLSLEDVFGADDGPWPLPGEYDSIALNEMNNLPLPQFANRLAISETTTTQITADRLTSSLAFDENESWLDAPHSPQNLIQNVSQNPSPVKSYRQRSLNAERPLRAWIETQAQSLGYVYGPIMSVVHWLDSLTVRIENFFVSCGRKIKQMLRWLLKGLK
jgi:hypothetical protein